MVLESFSESGEDSGGRKSNNDDQTSTKACALMCAYVHVCALSMCCAHVCLHRERTYAKPHQGQHIEH